MGNFRRESSRLMRLSTAREPLLERGPRDSSSEDVEVFLGISNNSCILQLFSTAGNAFTLRLPTFPSARLARNRLETIAQKGFARREGQGRRRPANPAAKGI